MNAPRSADAKFLATPQACRRAGAHDMRGRRARAHAVLATNNAFWPGQRNQLGMTGSHPREAQKQNCSSGIYPANLIPVFSPQAKQQLFRPAAKILSRGAAIHNFGRPPIGLVRRAQRRRRLEEPPKGGMVRALGPHLSFMLNGLALSPHQTDPHGPIR